MATNVGRMAGEYVAPVPRSSVELAARAGYMDAAADRRFSREYETQTDQWQRNYEIGRCWVAGMRGAGVPVPPWPEGASRPAGFDDALAQVTAKLGRIVVRADEHLPPDPHLVMRVSMHSRARRKGRR